MENRLTDTCSLHKNEMVKLTYSYPISMLFFFLPINLTINVAHPVFMMHIQSLLSGYAPARHASVSAVYINYRHNQLSLNVNLVCFDSISSKDNLVEK